MVSIKSYVIVAIAFLVLIAIALGIAYQLIPQKSVTRTESPVTNTSSLQESFTTEASVGSLPHPKLLNVTLRYGSTDRNVIYLSYPPNNKTINLVVWVHGGGFVTGSAEGLTSSKVIDFFTTNGFAVASVEYRVCPQVNWTQLLGDIVEGVKEVHEFLKEKGINVNISIYAGSSAGAIAGAVLIYAPPNPNLDISKYFKGFIGFSGGYCATYASGDPRNKASICGITIKDMMPFEEGNLHPPRKVPALLINGIYDNLLDKYAGQSKYNHQAECFLKWLKSNDINATIINLPAGHGTIKWLFAGSPQVMEAIQDFLHELGWEGKIRPLGDLVTYWSFDKVKGRVIMDEEGVANGHIYGHLYPVKGIVREALLFNGSGYVKFSKEAANLLGGFKESSISLWFKYEEPPYGQRVLPIFYLGIANESEKDNMFIIEIGHAREGNRRLYVTWVIDGRPTLCFDSGFNLKPGEWYHLVVVVSDKGNTAYLNGEELLHRHYNFGNPQKRLFLADIPAKEIVALGYGKTADKITPHFSKFYGIIDEVRIYSKPLTGDEAKQLYVEGLGNLGR